MLLGASDLRYEVGSGCFSQLLSGGVSAGGSEFKRPFRGEVLGIGFAVVGSGEVVVWVQGVWCRGLLESVSKEAEAFRMG